MTKIAAQLRTDRRYDARRRVALARTNFGDAWSDTAVALAETERSVRRGVAVASAVAGAATVVTLVFRLARFRTPLLRTTARVGSLAWLKQLPVLIAQARALWASGTAAWRRWGLAQRTYAGTRLLR
jgi:hypothetical protein